MWPNFVEIGRILSQLWSAGLAVIWQQWLPGDAFQERSLLTGRQSAENCVTPLRDFCPVSHSTQGILFDLSQKQKLLRKV
jgi:hypothetical protein